MTPDTDRTRTFFRNQATHSNSLGSHSPLPLPLSSFELVAPPPPRPDIIASIYFQQFSIKISRHARVAPKLPTNATVYIVAPHELFVTNLLPMTFFLLLLAFTDGTARTAEVLPRRALAQLAVAEEVLALDNHGVESYVYDSSLPAFHRYVGAAALLAAVTERCAVRLYFLLQVHVVSELEYVERSRITTAAAAERAGACVPGGIFVFVRREECPRGGKRNLWFLSRSEDDDIQGQKELRKSILRLQPYAREHIWVHKMPNTSSRFALGFALGLQAWRPQIGRSPPPALRLCRDARSTQPD